MIQATRKVDRVGSQLLKAIQMEKWQKGTKLPATTELAKRFGVSYVTVCNSLASLQKEGWVKRVNGVGTFLAKQFPEKPQIKKIGIPLRVRDNSFFTAAYEKMSAISNEFGIEIILGDGMHEEEFIERLAESDESCAMIRFPTNPSVEYGLQKKLQEHNIPAVILNDWWFHGGNFPCVCTNETASIEFLLDYLYEKGHRRIALLDDAYSSKRLEAHNLFFDWHWRHGIKPHQDQILYFWNPGKDYREELRRLPEKGITAIVSLFDKLTLETIDYLAEDKIKVPEDISIVSFDGIRQAESRNISFMRQDLDAMIRKAFEILLSKNYSGKSLIKMDAEFHAGATVMDISAKETEQD